MEARRILSLDGGGIRGLVTCRWLAGVEDALRDAGKPGLLSNFDLASEPPPLAATITSTVLPGTTETLTTPGVLSFVLMRLPAGSASTEARNLLSGWP